MMTLSDLISGLGHAIDTPGAYLRGALAGRPGDRATGEEMLGSWGLNDAGPLAGMLAEIAIDPLNAIGGAGFLKLRNARKIHNAEAIANNAKRADLLALGAIPREVAHPSVSGLSSGVLSSVGDAEELGLRTFNRGASADFHNQVRAGIDAIPPYFQKRIADSGAITLTKPASGSRSAASYHFPPINAAKIEEGHPQWAEILKDPSSFDMVRAPAIGDAATHELGHALDFSVKPKGRLAYGNPASYSETDTFLRPWSEEAEKIVDPIFDPYLHGPREVYAELASAIMKGNGLKGIERRFPATLQSMLAPTEMQMTTRASELGALAAILGSNALAQSREQ